MKKNQNSKIIYSLNIEDIQNVAEEELDRELAPSELKLAIDEIQKRIPWYEVIADTIAEVVDAQKQQ